MQITRVIETEQFAFCLLLVALLFHCKLKSWKAKLFSPAAQISRLIITISNYWVCPWNEGLAAAITWIPTDCCRQNFLGHYTKRREKKVSVAQVAVNK